MEQSTYDDKNQYQVGAQPGSVASTLQESGSELGRSTQPRPGRMTRIIKGWWQEALWCCLSFASFIALVALLYVFDGQPLPNWPSGITLNTLVAFLSTICKTAFIIPVAEGLSQSKWNRFKTKPRPLADFHAFDSASQSPWGSLKLVARTKQHQHPGSAFARSGIVTATLTQSAVAYTGRDVEIPTEGIAVAQRLPYHYFVGAGIRTQSQDLREFSRELSRAIFFPALEELPFREPHCAATNCTWSRYSTLAICAETTSVSRQAVVLNDELYRGIMDARLPNGLNMTLDLPESTSPGHYVVVAPGESLTRNGTQTKAASIYRYFALHFSQFSDKMRATEVNLHWCVNTYDTKVESNQLGRKLVKSHTEVHRGEFDKVGGFENGVSSNLSDLMYLTTPEDKGAKFVADGMGPSYFMPEILDNGLSSMTILFGDDPTRSASDMLTHAFRDVQDKRNEAATGEDTTTDEVLEEDWQDAVKRTSTNIANGLTNGLIGHFRPAEVSIKGTALRNQVFIEIRWPWIALLACQCLFSVLLLVLVIVETARSDIDIIKSLTLAALFAISAEEKAGLERRHTGGESLMGKDDHLLRPAGIGGELRKKDGQWVLGG